MTHILFGYEPVASSCMTSARLTSLIDGLTIEDEVICRLSVRDADDMTVAVVFENAPGIPAVTFNFGLRSVQEVIRQMVHQSNSLGPAMVVEPVTARIKVGDKEFPHVRFSMAGPNGHNTVYVGNTPILLLRIDSRGSDIYLFNDLVERVVNARRAFMRRLDQAWEG